MNADTARTQASLNRNNTITPFGTVTNVQTGLPGFQQAREQALRDNAGNPNFSIAGWEEAARRDPRFDQWETRVTLSPNQQRIANQGEELDIRTADMALGALPRVQRIMDTPLSLMRDDADARDRATAGIMSRLEPQFARDREALEGRLLAQGFQPGTEAYRRAADELNRTITDARMQAITAGLNESRAGAGFNNAITLTERQQPLSELAMLFGLGPGMQMPQAQQVAQVGVNPADLAGLVSNNYNQRSAQYGANMGALGSLFGAAGTAAGGWLRGS